MEFEDRLRSHLLDMAEGLEVPQRHLEITRQARPSRARTIATTVAGLAAVASVVGVSLFSAKAEPLGELDALQLRTIESAVAIAPPAPARQVARTGWSWALVPGVEATQLFELSDGNIAALGPVDPVAGEGLESWSLGSDGRLLAAHGTVFGTEYQTPDIQQGDQLVAVVNRPSSGVDQGGGRLLSSTDGHQWDEYAIPMVTQARAELILTADRTLIATFEPTEEDPGASQSAVPPDAVTGVRFLSTADNSVWMESAPPDLGEAVDEWTGFEEGRLYVVSATGQDGDSYLLTSSDLTTWVVESQSGVLHNVQPLAGGGFLAQNSDQGRPRLFVSEDFSTWRSITDDTGPPAVTVAEAVDSGGLGIASAYTSLKAGERGEFRTSMLFATDGMATWHLTAFTTETGGPGPVSDILVTDDAVLIAYGPSALGPSQVWMGRWYGAP